MAPACDWSVFFKALEYMAPACDWSVFLKALEYMAPACDWSVFRSDSLCSLLFFALPVFVFASVLTLIAISVERSVTDLDVLVSRNNNNNDSKWSK